MAQEAPPLHCHACVERTFCFVNLCDIDRILIYIPLHLHMLAGEGSDRRNRAIQCEGCPFLLMLTKA